MTRSRPSLARLAGEAYALAYRGAAGYEAWLWPDAALVLTGEAEAWFNVVVVGPGPRAADRLRVAVGVCRSRSVPALALVDGSAADLLAPVARELGLQEAGRAPWMASTGGMSAPGGTEGAYQGERVADEAGLQDAVRIAAVTFGIAPEVAARVWGPAMLDALGLDVFLVRRGGKPVSTVTTTRGGAIVGIWTMATPPEYQRRGAGRAVLDYAMAYHAARGAERFYLGATEAGQPLYERAGFARVGEVALWLVPVAPEVPTR